MVWYRGKRRKTTTQNTRILYVFVLFSSKARIENTLNFDFLLILQAIDLVLSK